MVALNLSTEPSQFALITPAALAAEKKTAQCRLQRDAQKKAGTYQYPACTRDMKFGQKKFVCKDECGDEITKQMFEKEAPEQAAKAAKEVAEQAAKAAAEKTAKEVTCRAQRTIKKVTGTYQYPECTKHKHFGRASFVCKDECGDTITKQSMLQDPPQRGVQAAGK